MPRLVELTGTRKKFSATFLIGMHSSGSADMLVLCSTVSSQYDTSPICTIDKIPPRKTCS